MDTLSQLLSFFGDPDVDQHRLLQGQWQPYRFDLDDPDAWSANPLELLLLMLNDELSRRNSDAGPAVQALHALLGTALECLAAPEFNSVKRPFWRGFQFVAHQAATELGVVFTEIDRDTLKRLIESRYAHHAA
jgi:hypothetical protein